MRKEKNTEDLIRELESRGYKVLKKKPKTKKHSFEVPEDLLAEFFELTDKHGLKIKEAVAEMFADWIKKRR